MKEKHREGSNALFIHMYSVCWVPVVKRIITSTRKERREKKVRNEQGLVALVNAKKSKELLIYLSNCNKPSASCELSLENTEKEKKGSSVQLSTAIWKMLTLGERKLMVLQTESDFPFTQITYIFQNVNSPAFPLRVQLSGGCFAIG